VLFVLVALACVAAFGFEDDCAVHGWAGAAALVVAIKVFVVRSGAGPRALPYLGVTLSAPARRHLAHGHARLPLPSA
jgi:hypothetical protein